MRNPRTGTDVVSSDAVRDIATTTDGKVRLTLLLAAGDDPALARVGAAGASSSVEGVTERAGGRRDASTVETRATRRRAARCR